MLAPDPASTRDQMSAQVNAAQAVTRNAQAVITLVPAYESAVTDPSLLATLQTAQQDVQAWPNGLCARAARLVPDLFTGFNTAYQAALGTLLAQEQQLAADPSSGAVRASLAGGIQQLLDSLQPLGDHTARVQADLLAFQNTLQADHGSVQSALQALESSVPGGGTIVRSAQAALGLDFVSSQQLSPCVAIVEIDAQVSVDLVTAAGAAPQVVPVVLCEALLAALATQNGTATQALSGLRDTWQTVTAKYQAAVQDLQNAQANQVGSILQELALQSAGEAWQQLASFADQIIQTPSGATAHA